jgi:hypothetical protein
MLNSGISQKKGGRRDASFSQHQNKYDHEHGTRDEQDETYVYVWHAST